MHMYALLGSQDGSERGSCHMSNILIHSPKSTESLRVCGMFCPVQFHMLSARLETCRDPLATVLHESSNHFKSDIHAAKDACEHEVHWQSFFATVACCQGHRTGHLRSGPLLCGTLWSELCHFPSFTCLLWPHLRTVNSNVMLQSTLTL